MNEIMIELKNDAAITLYEQIYEHIRNEVRLGKIPCGEKLPSTRALANHLQVSRSTVQMAYDQLVSEGYVESVSCKGYYAADVEGMYNVDLEKPNVDLMQDEQEYLYDFSPRGIDLDSFPFNSWRKITKNVFVDDNKELFSYGAPQGDLGFRRTISNYLYQSRGVVAKPENIIIGAGNEYLLTLLNQLIAGKKCYAMENPTYRQSYRILKSLGESIVVVEQDQSGMNVKDLEKSGANVAYVMPSHHYPLGIVMPMKRRMELLKWAAEQDGRYIVEDDYDSEFRYRGKPIPALCGFDQNQKVVYLGTFSKSIAPAIRMSYMVLPDALITRFHQKVGFYSCTVSRIDQEIVKQFMESGFYERHLNKMRALYKVRHEVLLHQLEPFREAFDVAGENAGIHLLIRSKRGLTEKELIERAAKVGVRVYPLSSSDIEQKQKERNTIILGYANMKEQEISEGIQLLKSAWEI